MEEHRADSANPTFCRGSVRSLLLEQPWSEILSVEEIAVDDTMLVARLRLPSDRSPAFAYDEIIFGGDTLVAFG